MLQDAHCLRKANECPCYKSFILHLPLQPQTLGLFPPVIFLLICGTCRRGISTKKRPGILARKRWMFIFLVCNGSHGQWLTWLYCGRVDSSARKGTPSHIPSSIICNLYVYRERERETVDPMRKSGKGRQRTERTNDRKEETKTRTSKHWAFSWHSRTNSLPKKQQYLYACRMHVTLPKYLQHFCHCCP